MYFLSWEDAESFFEDISSLEWKNNNNSNNQSKRGFSIQHCEHWACLATAKNILIMFNQEGGTWNNVLCGSLN